MNGSRTTPSDSATTDIARVMPKTGSGHRRRATSGSPTPARIRPRAQVGTLDSAAAVVPRQMSVYPTAARPSSPISSPRRSRRDSNGCAPGSSTR